MSDKALSSEVTMVIDQPESGEGEGGEDVLVPRLVVLNGINVGQIYPISKLETLVGRDSTADIQILDTGLSRIHFQITRSDGQNYSIIDKNSKNGTFLNAKPLSKPQLLADGDKIRVGANTVFKFSIHDDVEGQYAQKMYDAALRDDLTGIYNRRYFNDRILSEYAYAKRHKAQLSLLLLDIDHFKSINDTHGHPVGDRILKEVGEILEKSIRAEDVASRYGGEEFSIICRNTSVRDARLVGERIRLEVNQFLFNRGLDNEGLKVTVSIGISTVPQESIDSLEGFIKDCDEALYEAKNTGRNKVVARPSKKD